MCPEDHMMSQCIKLQLQTLKMIRDKRWLNNSWSQWRSQQFFCEWGEGGC